MHFSMLSFPYLFHAQRSGGAVWSGFSGDSIRYMVCSESSVTTRMIIASFCSLKYKVSASILLELTRICYWLNWPRALWAS